MSDITGILYNTLPYRHKMINYILEEEKEYEQ